jgi:Mg2+ and Co2+ transporter CorA
MAESAIKIYQKYVELSGNEELRQRVTEVRTEVMRWRELLKEQRDGLTEKANNVE